MQYIVQKKGYRLLPVLALAVLALGLTVAFGLPNPLGDLNGPKFEFEGNTQTEDLALDGVLDWDDTQAAVVNCLPATVGPPCEPNDNLDGDGVIEACRVLASGTIIAPNTEEISCATDGVTVPSGTPNGGCVQTNGPAVAGTSDAGIGAGSIGAGLLICDGSVGNDFTAAGGSTDLDVFGTGSHNEAADWEILTGTSSPKKTDLSDLSIYAKFGDSVFDDDDGDCGVPLDNTTSDGDPIAPPLTDVCRNDIDEDFDDLFIFTGATRLDVNGSSHLDVELSKFDLKRTVAEGGTCTQSPTSLVCPEPIQRTPGDVLIAIDLEGGGVSVQQRIFIQKCVEDTSTPANDCPDDFELGAGEVCANDPQVVPPCLVLIAAADVPLEAANGVLNTSEVQGPHWDTVGCDRTSGDATNGCKLRDDIVGRGFMETFTDLSFFGIDVECPGFSNVIFKSRASHGINSSLQDVAQGQIDIQKCSIAWEKRADTTGNLQGGATFEVGNTTGPFDCLGDTTNPVTVVDNGANDSDPHAGQLLLDNVCFGTYNVCETVAPSGFNPDPDDCRTVTVNSSDLDVVIGSPLVDPPTGNTTGRDDCPDGGDADVVTGDPSLQSDFCNLAASLQWLKEAKNASEPGGTEPFGGASFEVCPDPISGDDPGTPEEECLSVTDGASPDFDGANGRICIDGVIPSVAYNVEETASNDPNYLIDSDPTRGPFTPSTSTQCATRSATGNDFPPAFSNIPLSAITVSFQSLAGPGVTRAQIVCTDQPADSTTTPPGDNAGEDGAPDTLTIMSISTTNPAHVTTTTAHGLSTGAVVQITGSNSTPPIDGTFAVTFVDADTFSVAVDNSAGTTGSGTVLPLDDSSEIFTGLVPETYNCQVIIDP